MTDEDLLELVSNISYELLEEYNGHLVKLKEPYQTIAIIYNAQGIIDNGGLPYFFENDWPGQPNYDIFINAYEKIGQDDSANALREVVQTFGFDQPEKHHARRNAFIKEYYDEQECEVTCWNDCICGNETVWAQLANWVRRQER
ncbi:MAG: DUF4375 domain-containing protein [Lentisphaeria bacterium]|nr:DUF4375 domain-containing protein [Lentisphaeria bacterium]